jgi:hypothetical protein
VVADGGVSLAGHNADRCGPVASRSRWPPRRVRGRVLAVGGRTVRTRRRSRGAALGFAEILHYSEWQGYDEFDQPPSERVHPNDPAAVQSWRQTGYPGFVDGYVALRGYVGTPDGPLGDGGA